MDIQREQFGYASNIYQPSPPDCQAAVHFELIVVVGRSTFNIPCVQRTDWHGSFDSLADAIGIEAICWLTYFTSTWSFSIKMPVARIVSRETGPHRLPSPVIPVNVNAFIDLYSFWNYINFMRITFKCILQCEYSHIFGNRFGIEIPFIVAIRRNSPRLIQSRSLEVESNVCHRIDLYLHFRAVYSTWQLDVIVVTTTKSRWGTIFVICGLLVALLCKLKHDLDVQECFKSSNYRGLRLQNECFLGHSHLISTENEWMAAPWVIWRQVESLGSSILEFNTTRANNCAADSQSISLSCWISAYFNPFWLMGLFSQKFITQVFFLMCVFCFKK